MKKPVWMLAAWLVLQALPAQADSGDVMAALEGMKKQMAQMQATIDAQNLRIQQLESRTVLEKPQAPVSVGEPMTAKEWQKGIKENAGDAIPWLKGTKLGGDFRLREESFHFYDKNAGQGATDRSRNRTRIRLRYGVEKELGDEWKAGFRLATATAGTNGLATDQTSTNVTLGNPGEFAYKNVYVDRAYGQYAPAALKNKGALEGVTIAGGKFENPFLRYSTGIVWDADVTPEGLYERAAFTHLSTERNKLSSYWTAGQFITNENSGVDTDAELFGWQGALAWSTSNFGTAQPVELATAVSYYEYPNYFLTAQSNTLGSVLRTNTAALDDPRVLDWYSEAVFTPGPWPVALWGDFAKNVGEIDSTREIVSPHGDDGAWGIGARLGKLKKKGDWELSYGYYEIGANAVVAAFNDSDFGGPGYTGFTNREGHKIGFGYQLADAVQVNLTGFFVEPVVPAPSSTVANSADESVFRFQADLVWKF